MGHFTCFHQMNHFHRQVLCHILHFRSRKTHVSHNMAHLKLPYSQMIALNEGYAILSNFNFTLNLASALPR